MRTVYLTDTNHLHYSKPACPMTTTKGRVFITLVQDRQSTYSVTLRRVRVTVVAVEKHCLSVSACARVALLIQHATRRHIVIRGVSGATVFFDIS